MNLIGVNAPVRLLREKWATPEALAQELYAMFTAQGPAELHDTLTIRVGHDRPALRIERAEGPDTFITEIHHGGISKNAVSTAPAQPGHRAMPRPELPFSRWSRTVEALTPHPSGERGEGSKIEARPRPQPTEAPLVEIDGPVRFSGPAVQFTTAPVIVNQATGEATELGERLRLDRTQPSFGGAAVSATYVGVVLDGSGDTYDVQLYPDGLSGMPGRTVQVTIPVIAHDELLNPGYVLAPIWKAGGTYYAQPPVWQ